MYAVSEQWKRTIKRSHTALARVDIQRGDATTTFPVHSGRINISYDDPVRWGLDVEVVDEFNRTYEEMKALTSPFVALLIPYLGVRYPDGTEEWIECGKYYVRDVEVGESVGGPTWRLNSFDASSRLMSRLPEPYYIEAGQDPGLAVVPFLQKGFSGLTVIATRTAFTTPTLLLRAGDTRWTEARKIVAAAGLDLTVDRRGFGVQQSRQIDAADAAPVWHFDENTEPDFANPTRRVTLDDKPNVVRVVGTHPNVANVSGIAADMDPNSNTFRYGPLYGEQVKVFESEHITTQEQANAMARYLLSKLLGPQDQVTLNVIRNPALDVGDVVMVTRERIGLLAERMIVANIELPMGVTDWMQVTCRRSIFTENSSSIAVSA